MWCYIFICHPNNDTICGNDLHYNVYIIGIPGNGQRYYGSNTSRNEKRNSIEILPLHH